MNRKNDKKPGFFKSVTGAFDDAVKDFKAEVDSMTPQQKQASLEDQRKQREKQQRESELAGYVAQSIQGLAEEEVGLPSTYVPETDGPEEAESPENLPAAKPKVITTIPTGNLWQALTKADATTRLTGDACYHALTAADVQQYASDLKAENVAPFTLGIVAINLPALTEEEVGAQPAAAADALTQSLAQALENNIRLFGAIGAGPRNLWSNLDVLDKFLTNLLNENQKIIALGPIGIDEPFAPYTLAQQKSQLALQLEIAAEFQIPALLSHRKSASHLREVLESAPTLPELIFADALQTQEDLDLVKSFRMYTLLRPEITQPDTQAALYKALAPAKVLLACGSALVAPQGFSGHFNQPRFLQNTLAAAARVFGHKEYDLLAQTNRNLANLFLGI